jgi:iron complex outermembrane recepter protein
VRRFLGCVRLTALFLCTAFLSAIAIAQARIHFDLPAQPLARTLKAIGTVTNTDVGFSASQVEGLLAPSLQADLTVDDALMRVLVGTGLRPQHLNDHTIVIAAVTLATSALTKAPSQAFVPTDTTEASPSVAKVADILMLGQADGTTAGPPDNSSRADKSSDEDQLQELVVTGTHIRGVSPSSPVVTITRQDIDESGYTSIGDVMRSLPQNYGGGNSPQLTVASAPGIDNGATFSGGSSPNLRGLGSGSTLTLVNGHRLADDTVNGAVDISLIPLAAIERVEVVTDGASAAYGSDAVAGVVNIILKKDYNGSQTSILGGGTSQGGGTEKQVNQLLGKTWATGGVLIDYEFDRTDPIYSTQRDYTLEAASPTTLSPGSSRNSVFLSANQNFGERVSAFVDALYTYRILRDSVSYAGEDFTLISDVDVHQYSTAFGLEIKLPSNWQLRPTVELAEQRSVDTASQIPYFFYPILTFEGRTSTFEAVADGPLIALPAGAVRAALGGGYRRQTFAYLEQDSPAVVDTDRGVEYAYAEIAVPLYSPTMGSWIRKLDLSISGREEHYSDFGREGVPRFGLAYSPTESIKVRGTWGKAFRAPPLYALFGQKGASTQIIPNPASVAGTSPVLIEGGGDANLQPETAKTWTAGIDYESALVKGLHLSATYFDIAYINRISQIPTYFSALTNPLFAPFVTPSPSAALQQSVINGAGPYFYNPVLNPYNPNAIAALINNELVNVARQDIKGVDLAGNYKWPTYKGSLEVFANASYLDLRQQFVPRAPEVEISGQAFEPSKIRARTGASWTIGPIGATGIVNFTGSEANIYQPNDAHIASWTTVDLQLSFRPQWSGVVAGFQAALSVQNVFDRDPPFVLFDQYVPGLHYDPTNASVLGRFISLRLSKEFK